LAADVLNQASTQRGNVAARAQQLRNQQTQPLAGMGEIDMLLAALGLR
jgi:hypothetical protein